MAAGKNGQIWKMRNMEFVSPVGVQGENPNIEFMEWNGIE